MEFLRNHPEVLLIGGLILITAFLFSRINRRRKQGTPSILTPHEQLERLRQARGMRGDLEELMVEIEQMAKRMGAHLDAKAMRLEHLLEQADQRIEQLRALRERPADASPPEKEDRPTSAAHASVASSAQLAGSSLATSTDSLPDDPLARKVYTLADSGHSAMQIARELREHIGKVELILALRHA